MPPPTPVAHGMSHRFVVVAGSHNLGSWSKVAGLSVNWDLAEHRIGSSDQYFKFAGVPKFEKLKLSRAAEPAGTQQVQTWLNEVHTSGGVPEEGAVEVLTSAGTPVISWTLREMFPIGWQISDFDASASSVAMETLVIVYSGFLTASAGRRR
jgi:phage tail-like protein